MATELAYRHRDAYGRVVNVKNQDADRERYLRPRDGKLDELTTQGFSYDGIGQGCRNWVCKGKPSRNVPTITDVVYFAYSPVLKKGSEERDWSAGSSIIAFTWLPACIALLFLLLIPRNLEGYVQNGGFYDPIRYKDSGYPKVAKNRAEKKDSPGQHEDGPSQSEGAPLLPDHGREIEMSTKPKHSRETYREIDNSRDEDFDNLPTRQFRPKYLCFRKQTSDPYTGRRVETFETRKVSEYVKEHGENADTNYVFVSYTRMQFCVKSTMDNKPGYLDDKQWSDTLEHGRRDRETLLQYGINAAREAEVPAFWIDFEGIRNDDNSAPSSSDNSDVYAICDIVRATHSMIIVLGPSFNRKAPSAPRPTWTPELEKQWMHEYGDRLWTLPEILLCPSEFRIKLWVIGSIDPKPQLLAKRNFAVRAYRGDDAKRIQELLDHYESSIHLSPLELISIGLECLQTRGTEKWNEGDVSYALMGLLRRRPPVNKKDTEFEAFARLSLVNYSDLLERMVCMLPIGKDGKDAEWHNLNDAWGAKLWDIKPHCQVAGIVDDEAVTLDGAHGAAIKWNRLDPVPTFKRPRLIRTFGKILLRGSPGYFLSGISLMAGFVDVSSGGPASEWVPLLIIGLLHLIPGVIGFLAAPAMLFDIYHGKFWSTQAMFYGIEGFADVGTIEEYLFGYNHGRIKWSTSGSPLSRHHYEDGECIPVSPMPRENVRRDANGNITQRLFTLVDTFTLTAHCFYAERPPTAVIICGHEGGMQRALLCSYDWRRRTFCRETVLRMDTLVLDRMFRVSKFRFALRRLPNKT